MTVKYKDIMTTEPQKNLRYSDLMVAEPKVPTEPNLAEIKNEQKEIGQMVDISDNLDLPVFTVEQLYEPLGKMLDAIPDPKDVTIGPVEVPVEKEKVPMEIKAAEPKKGIFEKLFGFRYPPKPPDWDRASPIERFNFITLPISDVLGRIGGKIASDWRLMKKEDVQKTLAHELADDLKWYQKAPEAVGWTSEKVAEYLLLKGIFKASGLHRVLTAAGQKAAAPFLAKEITARGGLKTVSTLSAAGLKNLGRKALTSFLTAAPENATFIASWSGLDAAMKGESPAGIAEETARGAGWGLALTAGLSMIAPIAQAPELRMAFKKAIARVGEKYPGLVDRLGKAPTEEVQKEWLKALSKSRGKDVRLIDLSKREAAIFRNAVRAAEREILKAAERDAAIRGYWAAQAQRVKEEAAKAAEKVSEKARPSTEVLKRQRVEILPRKTEILAEIDEAIKKAPTTADYDQAKKPRVHFEIDGGANIQDNKDALKQFRQRVAKLPETELWPKAVIHKVGKKKPIAATKEKIGELVKAPEGWFTDGTILVKGKPPAKAKRVEDWEKRTPVKIDDIIHAPTESAEFQHYAIKDPSYGEGISDRPVPHIEEPGTTGPLAVFKSGDKYFIYDQDIYNVLRNRYPDAEYGIKAETGLLVAYMGRDNPVAAMMGITLDKAEGPGMAEPPVKLEPLPEEVEPKAPEKIEPLKTYQAEVELPNKEKAAFEYQYIEYPKTGQHEYGFNFHNKTIGHPDTGIIHHSAKATEVDAAGGPIEYAKKWAAERYAQVNGVGLEAKTEAVPKARIADVEFIKDKWDNSKLGYRVELVMRGKWITKKGQITKSGEKYAQSKWDELSPAVQNVVRKFIAQDYNRQLQEAQPPAKAEEVKPKQFEILNSRGQRYGDLFESREEAQKYLEKRITSAAGRIQFTIQEVKAKEPQQLYDELIAKWGDDAVSEAQEILSDENETYQDIEAKFVDLDSAGKGNTEEAKVLERQLFGMVDDYLSREPEGPIEQPSLFAPEPAEHLSKVVVDEFRAWPESIKKVGKDYWTEVMAAAKKLLTPYRYRALRRTLLGAFRREKRPVPKIVGIEVQDVRDALTATHELGHNIDWLLNNKVYPRSIKARFPDTTVGEMSLRNELKKISKVLRPDMWEKPKAYIKGHTELMADFISHYILDPEKAKELAPNITKAFEAKLAEKPELSSVISRLQDIRYEGPKEPPIAKTIREQLRMPAELKPLQLHVDLSDENYVKAAEQLGITASRQYKMLMNRAKQQAQRIDKLVSDKLRQTDLVVIAEEGEKNPWTGKTREEILKETPLTENEKKALNLYRAYQELARQTVNKYLRGADIAEYIKFIEDYFIHTYQTPMTQKYRTAINKWAKRSPQAKMRVLPDLATAVEIGLTPRAKTLSEGLNLWAGINYRVATNKAFLSELPKLTNENGESILQKPQDKPDWPTVDYFPIRKHYAIPLPGRGILLHEGRVAVDPKLKPFIDAMFGYMFTSRPAYVLAAVNAVEKAFQLTVFSAFHHVAEFFSTVGGVGEKIIGVWGKSAKPFEDTLRTKLAVHLPAVGPFYAGSQLKQVGEFMEDYLAHGGQTGYISGEGIGLIDNMLKDLRHYFERLMISQKPSGKALWIPYLPVKTVQQAHHAWQRFLWGTIVENGKLFTYYDCVQDGLRWADKGLGKVQKEIDEVSEKALQAKTRGDKTQAQKYYEQLEKLYGKKRDIPSVDRIKEMVAQYINNNYGGQEWLNTMFRKPKFRWTFFQIFRSWDWTYGQLKTPLYLTGRGLGARTKAERELFRQRGRRHWLWYLMGVFGATEGLQFALNRRFTWQNEPGHRFDVDYTKVWRFKDELKSKILGTPNWKERGDNARRYTVFGKAGREVLYWFREPLTEFGRKLSPLAQTMMEQFTGYNIGSDFAEPWKTQDLELYEELWERAKNIGEKVVPFSFRGNNAFLALPLRKGMTRWKAIRSYQDIYSAKAKIAYESKLNIALLKAGRVAAKPALLFANEEKLRKDIAEACKLNKVDALKADQVALSHVKSIYYGKLSRAANNREIEECNKYARALIELGATSKSIVQSIRSRGIYLTPSGREIEVEAFQKAVKEYFEKQVQNK